MFTRSQAKRLKITPEDMTLLFSNQAKKRKKITTQAIHEIKEFSELLQHVKPETLVLCDLDNTIIHLAQSLGSDEWFEKHLEKSTFELKDFSTALNTTLDVFHKVQERSVVKATEEHTVSIIQDLQTKNQPIVGLTARSRILQHTTRSQLDSIGLTLNKGMFANKSFAITQSEHGHVHDGIIFSGGQDKGVALTEFLHKVAHMPKHILFIDDKHVNLTQVATAAANLCIDFVGLHYTRLKHKLAEFHWPIVEKQFEIFNNGKGELLSDEEARDLLAGKLFSRRPSIS